MAMKCQECGCVVTQAEADEADHIQNDGLTRCPKCAEATADAATLARTLAIRFGGNPDEVEIDAGERYGWGWAEAVMSARFKRAGLEGNPFEYREFELFRQDFLDACKAVERGEEGADDHFRYVVYRIVLACVPEGFTSIIPAVADGFAIGKLSGLTWDEIEGHAAEVTRDEGDVYYRGRFLCTVYNDEGGGGTIDENGHFITDLEVQEAISRIDASM